jgi:hypothetical protein
VARFQVLAWQDVPSVVKVVDGETTLSQQLPDWFQQEIDRRAMEQGLIGSDAYLEQWEWSPAEERAGSAQEVLDVVVAELQARFGR